MKIKLIQLDTMDAVQENQVHRIRKQINQTTVEYIEKLKNQNDPASWDLQIYCSSEPFVDCLDSEGIYFTASHLENRISWRILHGLKKPWDGEWLVQAMFELAQVIPKEKLNKSYDLEFYRVKKEKNSLSAYKSVSKLTKIKEKPLTTILFVQDTSEVVEDSEEARVKELIIPLKQKMEMDILCLVYPGGTYRK